MIRFVLFFLERYFGRVADDRFERFCAAHITSLVAHPRFANLAPPTQMAYDDYFGARAGQDKIETKRLGLTQAVQLKLEEFQSLVSRHAGAIASRWGKDSLEYRRFYPNGLSEYRNANLQSVGTLMERYTEGLQELGKHLPDHVIADFLAPIPTDADPNGTEGGIIPRFRAVRATHLAAKGGVEESRRQRTGNRNALEHQIMENVLTVALAVLREDKESKGQALRLFPQNLLSKPKRDKKEGEETGKAKKAAKKETAAKKTEEAAEQEAAAEATETTVVAEATEGTETTAPDPARGNVPVNGAAESAGAVEDDGTLAG